MPGPLAAIGVVLAAFLLVWIPKRLFTEAAGAPPSQAQSWLLMLALTGVGLTAGYFLGAGLYEKAALALVLMTLAGVVASDLRYLTIPDLYSAVVALLGFLGPLSPGLLSAVAGAVLCGGLLALLAWFWRWRMKAEGLGFGDVKLAAALGAVLGPQVGLWAITGSAFAGALIGYMLLARRKDEDSPFLFPYGAPLALAGAAMIVVREVRPGWLGVA